MVDWFTYWNTSRKVVDSADPFQQVGKTVGGVSITEKQLQAIVDDVCDALNLHKDDYLLDICCGNGLLSYKLAKHCAGVVGIDYSKPLLSIAKTLHKAENVRYLYMSARDMSDVIDTEKDLADPKPFDKAVMYEALQYFEHGELEFLLKSIASKMSTSGPILFGSIPDESKQGNFADTPSRKLKQIWYRLIGRDPMGTWWDRSSMLEQAQRASFDVKFFRQSCCLHTSHYRFDALFEGRQ